MTVLPLADAFTYYLAGPIYVTVLAASFSRRRSAGGDGLAVLVGFVGVVIALQPGAGAFGWHALIAFLGSLFYARADDHDADAARHVADGDGGLADRAGLLFGLLVAPIDWVPLASVDGRAAAGLVGVVVGGRDRLRQPFAAAWRRPPSSSPTNTR